MVSYENLYAGADYGLDSTRSEYATGVEGVYGVRHFSAPSDPRTSNQLQAVSNKISTGLKNIEVSGVNLGGSHMGLIDTIPKQQFKEINRLKKLAGVDFTFHGPLVEPTGIGRGNWDESQRKQAEREILSSIQRGHQIDPEGNIVVTFHASNGLPEARNQVLIKDENGKEKLVDTDIAVIDERTGRFGALPIKPSKDYLFGKEKTIGEELDHFNRQNWNQALSNLTINQTRIRQALEHVEPIVEKLNKEILPTDTSSIKDLYAYSKEHPEELYKISEAVGKKDPLTKQLMQTAIDETGYADILVREAYQQFQDLFNQAYFAAERDNKKELRQKLDEFKKEVAPKLEKYKPDSTKITELSEEINRGIRLLGALTQKDPPRLFRPIEEFAREKSAQTFANAALEAYKEFGDKTPIISIENPPAGSGIYRAEDLKQVVIEARSKLASGLIKEKGLSPEKAQAEAEKLIGVTWDVGHINMLRAKGFGDKHLVEETKTIAPYVKHIHLSDNFGLDHTELPMGMGNVPLKGHLAALQKQFGDKMNKIKQVIETGNWFKDFKSTPLMETLTAYGSPIYPMTAGARWNMQHGAGGGYFAGYGLNPDHHHSLYGAGFSNIPLSLGGQMEGRSRLAGTPNE